MYIYILNALNGKHVNYVDLSDIMLKIHITYVELYYQYRDFVETPVDSILTFMRPMQK